LNKNNGRGVSTGKINGNIDFAASGNYNSSLSNINGGRFVGNTNGMSLAGTYSMQNIGGMSGLTKSSKVIPKKDSVRDQNHNFSSTQGVKSQKYL